jgi:hypothetical protein
MMHCAPEELLKKIGYSGDRKRGNIDGNDGLQTPIHSIFKYKCLKQARKNNYSHEG